MDSVVTHRMSVIGSETVCHASASLAGSKPYRQFFAEKCHTSGFLVMVTLAEAKHIICCRAINFFNCVIDGVNFF